MEQAAPLPQIYLLLAQHELGLFLMHRNHFCSRCFISFLFYFLIRDWVYDGALSASESCLISTFDLMVNPLSAGLSGELINLLTPA